MTRDQRKAFARTYSMFAASLEVLLGDWDNLPRDERNHHSDELIRLLVTRGEALLGRFDVEDLVTLSRIYAADDILLYLSNSIFTKMGIHPNDFIISGDVEAPLSFIAEELGRSEKPGAVGVLLAMLWGQPSGLIREGVVYGLSRHADDPRVRDALRRAANEDESEAVRSAAADALDET